MGRGVRVLHTVLVLFSRQKDKKMSRVIADFMVLAPKIDLKTSSRQIFLPVPYAYILSKLLSGVQTKLEEGERKQRKIQWKEIAWMSTHKN